MKPSPAPELERWRVNYAGSSTSLDVTVIHLWNRADLPAVVMSASSGPKDYLCNRIFTVFESVRAADAVAMVRANGPAFLLLRSGEKYFDMAGKEVQVVQENGVRP